MLLVHENLSLEASIVADTIKKVYNIPVEVISHDLSLFFIEIPGFNGYQFKCTDYPDFLVKSREESNGFSKAFNKNVKRVKYTCYPALFLTTKDLYANNENKNESWIFGQAGSNLDVVSTARLKREDNNPSSNLEISFDRYINRINWLVIHELGHELLKDNNRQPPNHYKTANLVSVKNNYELWLGDHCTDNTCVMYEVIDIKAPDKNDSYMLLGDEMTFDNGLDNNLERLRPDYLCDKCRESINIPEKYYWQKEF